MAEDRTEPATPRRRQDARSKGQVARSPEIGSAFILLVGFFVLWLYGPKMYEYLQGYMKWVYSPVVMVHLPLTETNVGYLFMDMFAFMARLLAPFLIPVVIVAFLANYYQVGLSVSTGPIKPSFGKLNPLNGVKRLFSLRAFVELFKNLIKLTLIGWVAYAQIRGMVPEFTATMDMGLRASIAMLAGSTVALVMKIAAIMIIIAFLDYIYQKYEFEKSLKMTKQEVKDEHKQREGDPMVRSRIRQKQREIAMMRMMKEVPKADVVITNPIRLAIALQYAADEMHAPKVTAKGAGVVAEKIRAIAKENRVPIVEDRWLAQSLFKMTDVGDYVPPNLFKAVAEILAYVYRMAAKRHKFGI